MAQGPTAADGRASGRRATPAGAGPSWGGSPRGRQGPGASQYRRRAVAQPADHYRRQYYCGNRPAIGDRRRRTVSQSGEAGELLRVEPVGLSVGPNARQARPHHQAGTFVHTGVARRGSLGRSTGAWPSARFLPARTRPSRTAGRHCRDGTQTGGHRVVRAHAQ